MKRYTFFGIILFSIISALPAGAVNVFKHYDKVIWIDQPRQSGAAYEKGQKLFSFSILSGDDETPTPPGAYVVKVKDANYYSRKYQQPMSYSIFIDFKAKRAIHEGGVPDQGEKSKWATHGCIHVEEPYIKRLFDWAEPRKTLIVIRGKRDWSSEEQVGEVDEGIQETPEKEEIGPEEEIRPQDKNQLREENQQREEIPQEKESQPGDEDEDTGD
ncbi:MAG: L,D-transpeptidase [Deltaproteobacteria bacterium]|nr:L,D-transpeptidase [Deltaproteobacteria bacterium]